MDKQSHIITEAGHWVQRIFQDDAGGHDVWHVKRVAGLAVKIAEAEGADVFICELAALLHDLPDEKLTDRPEQRLNEVKSWLNNVGIAQKDIDHITHILTTMSYRGGGRPPMSTKEGMVVQDADRLDAIGAIGIARTFAFAGSIGERMHEPGAEATAIRHFYDKLLRLKSLMNTKTAKAMAEQRHSFLDMYLRQFADEWQEALNDGAFP